MNAHSAFVNFTTKFGLTQRANICRKFLVALLASLTLLAGVASAPALAQQETPAQPQKPFQLPFAEPPGPDTWLMAQPYGNTTGAYRQRFTTYGASGGIHFGVDLSAPCGTDIVAIADGVVFKVDGPFGSPPHNLMIDHPQLGYASMYGHLLEAPNLKPGQKVKQGEVVAKSGDSGETCYNRPHLHLEIRDLAHVRKYNPTTLIDANWDDLALTGNSGRDFARDLSEPRKWQSLYDQPEVQTGGPIVNDFANPWPLDWEKSAPPNRGAYTPEEVITTPTLSSTARPPAAAGRQLTGGDCCTNPAWSPDSGQIRYLDQPAVDLPLGVWGVDLAQSSPQAQFVTGWLGQYSPDESFMVYPDAKSGLTVIERLADGQTWKIDTDGRRPSFTPDGQRLVWTVSDEDSPNDNRLQTVWQANTDGSDAHVILSARRINAMGWLPDDTLLLSRRVPGGSDQTLFLRSPVTGRETELVTLPQPRGMALSPDGRYLLYYVTFQQDASLNGTWLLDLTAKSPAPQKLGWFGTYRWRDAEHIIYVPFDPAAAEHSFFEYNVTSGQSRELFPGGTGLTIANNDWRISPDGSKIALVAANGPALNGIWVLELK
ncbi:MAG: hypothetical protein FOGNACKC_05951 [Anaerolineae bacterium]|nr:hypothetical protein [Anaerolineae bacterium]